MAEDYSKTQRIEAKDSYVQQHINEAYEIIRDEKADPPVQPEIQLKQGWKNGNIKIGVGPPTRHDVSEDPRLYSEEHHWDIYLQLDEGDESSPLPLEDDWTIVSAIYVRTPPS